MARILMLNYEYPPLGGGAANATKYLINELARQPDLELDLITSSTDSYKIERCTQNIRIHFLDINKKGNLHYQTNKDLLTYSWRAHAYARRLIKKRKFDICHAFFGIPCGYIARQLGLPYIVSLRGSDVPFYNERFYWPDKLVFKRLSGDIWRRSSATVANSIQLAQLANSSHPNQKIGIIHNGVDTHFFRPAERLESLDRPLKIISIGRLIERKGYRYLLTALKDMPVHLTLVGDGNQRRELEALAADLEVSTEFAGIKNKNEVVQLLQQSDVYVLPSLNEGMSNATLEAMACGLPVIVTDTGGAKELVDDGVNGYIVPRANSIELANKIGVLLDNSRTVISMGQMSRRRAENMSWKKTAEQYRQLYYELS